MSKPTFQPFEVHTDADAIETKTWKHEDGQCEQWRGDKQVYGPGFVPEPETVVVPAEPVAVPVVEAEPSQPVTSGNLTTTPPMPVTELPRDAVVAVPSGPSTVTGNTARFADGTVQPVIDPTDGDNTAQEVKAAEEAHAEESAS